MTNPVFLVDDLTGDELCLDGPEGRHAATVKRLRVGEELDLVDGRGTRCTCTVTSVGKDRLACRVVTRTVEARPEPQLSVVQALAKGGRGELAVELATEVGVDRVIPWSAARSVVGWNDDKGLERWRGAAREAAKQSRRAWFPEVTALHGTEQVAQLDGQLLVLHEQATTPLSAQPLTGADVVLVVGPEGGITAQELAVLTAAGGQPVRLGSSVLRTSTAGAAAAAVVSSRIGRW